MADDNRKAVKLPVTGKRNILITSALPYVNNYPHLGNIIGCVLSADVFARYCRLRGYVVLYICGTDEYGTATETKALQEKKEPKEICDEYHAIHKEVYEWFGISFDKFGRTSTPQHTKVCHAIFKKLWDNKYISERTEPQLYCDTCDRFLADRLVEGTCPTPGCNNDSARGDECKNCDKLLSKATDLINPRCKECKSAPRERDTKHLYLKLPDLEHDLRDYIEKTSEAGSWSKNAITTTNAWLEKGLKERSITRDLKWGVPVPVLENSLEEYEDKVFYVWFDAPIGYMSITSCYTQEWETWWKNPENVELYQFMGKDNVPFHTVMFPSTLIGTKEKWTMMKTISVTEYLRYETGKFSKSEGVGVFGNDAKDTEIPVEVWRYYLLANRPETSDTLFTWAGLQAKQNGELVKNLGNFINRVLSFIAKKVKEVKEEEEEEEVKEVKEEEEVKEVKEEEEVKEEGAKKEKEKGGGYSSIVPDAPGAESHSLTKIFGEEVSNYVAKYVEAMEKVKLKEGLKIAMDISNAGNAYLQKSKYWEHYKNDRSACSIVVKTAVGVVYILACLIEPFMPSFSKKVLDQLNLRPLEVSSLLYDDDEEHWKNVPALPSCKELGDIIVKAQTPWDIVPAGHTIGTPSTLFEKMKDKKVEILRNKFAGSQADRAARQAEA